MLNWFKESNHSKHFYAGGLMMFGMLAICLLLQISLMCSSIVSFLCVLFSMMTAEYKDKLHGGLFDWEDILAGMIVPVIVLIVSVIL